jgi:signal transduction histidine kinase
MLRCAQEMITNSVRHARADNLWIILQHDREKVSLNAHDDGQGVKTVEPGNGLNGMAERLRQLGGGLDIESKPGAGFRLQAWVPVETLT